MSMKLLDNNDLYIYSGEKAKAFLLNRYPEDTLYYISQDTDLDLDMAVFVKSEDDFKKTPIEENLLQIWIHKDIPLAIIFASPEDDSNSMRIRLFSVSNLLKVEKGTASEVFWSYLRLAESRGITELRYPLYPDTEKLFMEEIRDELNDKGWSYTSELENNLIILRNSTLT